MNVLGSCLFYSWKITGYIEDSGSHIFGKHPSSDRGKAVGINPQRHNTFEKMTKRKKGKHQLNEKKTQM
jgi:hypothetical protein